MQLYSALPATNRSWTTTSIESLQRLRGVKQTRWNQVVVSRVELIRLIVFTAIELSAHITATAAKFAAAVIQVPLCPIFGGVKPRVALIDARSHLSRAGKLGTIILCSPAFLARPEWAVGLYQRFALVKEPRWWPRAVDVAFSQIGLHMIYKHVYLGWFHPAPSQWWVRYPVLAGVAGVLGAAGTVSVVVLASRACCRKKLSASKLEHQFVDFKKFLPAFPVHTMHNLPDGGMIQSRAHRPDCFFRYSSDDKVHSYFSLAGIVAVQANGDIVCATGTFKRVIATTTTGGRSQDVTYLSHITAIKELSNGMFATGFEDGKLVLSGNDKSIQFDADVEEPVVAVTWVPHFEGVAAVYRNRGKGKVRMWRENTAPITYDYSVPFGVACLEASKDGRYLAMNVKSGGTHILDLSNGLCHILQGDGTVTAIHWLSAEGLLTGDSKGVLRAWNATNGEFLGERRDHSGPIYSIQQLEDDILTSSHDGKTLRWTGLSNIAQLTARS